MKGSLRSGPRWFFYLLGMLVLAMGITLNSMTGLGASAIVSVPFTISQGTGLNFGDLTLLVYVLFVAAQFVIMGKARSWTFLLQIPLSIVFTRIMNLIQAFIPYQSGSLPANLAMLMLAIVLTGVGAAMTVDMALIPNPGDGIVSSIARRSGRELGLCKKSVRFGVPGGVAGAGGLLRRPADRRGAGHRDLDGGRRPGDRGVQPLVPPPDAAPGRAGTRLTPGPFAAGRPKRPHPPRRAGHAPPAGLFCARGGRGAPSSCAGAAFPL